MTRFTDPVVENVLAMDMGKYRGPGSIGSTSHGLVVRKNGAPVSRAVQLIPKAAPNFVIAETRSDASGNWSINNLSLEFTFIARVWSDDGNANPAVADWLKAVV